MPLDGLLPEAGLPESLLPAARRRSSPSDVPPYSAWLPSQPDPPALSPALAAPSELPAPSEDDVSGARLSLR